MPELQSFLNLSLKHLYAAGLLTVALCYFLPPQMVIVSIVSVVGGVTTHLAGLKFGLIAFVGALRIASMNSDITIRIPCKSNIGFTIIVHRLPVQA